MNLTDALIDDVLIEWDDGEYHAEVKLMGQRSKAVEISIGLSDVIGGAGGGANLKARRAQAVRDRLRRTVQKVPEVMVKITSSSRGMKQIGRHFDYITRNGQIDLEDDYGFIVQGRSQLKDTKEAWRIGGVQEIADKSIVRDTLNIVFSMPAETNEVSLKRAVRAFAATEFEDHQYVFAYHTRATDPDPDPPRHPHIHLSVKIQGRSGRRLNPRKADLQRWRQEFAAQLRANGVEANATTRLARLNRQKSQKRSYLALIERGEITYSRGKSSEANMSAREVALSNKRKDYYRFISRVLSQSANVDDRTLGAALSSYFDLDRTRSSGTHALLRGGVTPEAADPQSGLGGHGKSPSR